MNTMQPMSDRHYLLSQAEIAEHLGISRMRVFTLEQNALRKIRRAIETELTAKNQTLAEWAGIE